MPIRHFKTRGVPGTHDVTLGIEILTKLKNSSVDTTTYYVPVFDKATVVLRYCAFFLTVYYYLIIKPGDLHECSNNDI